MQQAARDLTIEELAQQTGAAVRTIRFYIAEGLLPGPGKRGKQASYGEEHLLRLRLIRRLVDERVPLAEQRERLGRLSLDDLRTLLAEADRRSNELARARETPAPKEYVATLLRQARSARETPPTLPARPPAAAAPAPAGAAPDGTYRRWELAPGVELHVRTDAERREAGLIQRVLRAAGWRSGGQDR